MIDLLKESRVFRECSTQELEAIAKICHRVTFKNGERICEAESPAEYLFIVSEGAVELRFKVTHYHAAKEITLDRKFKSEAFGWSALTEPFIYTLSALAMQDSELLRIKANDIKGLCTKNNHLGFVIMKNIAEIVGERFASVQKILIDVIQQNLIEKER
ncbi:MAG: Crp/Fnr family transcriptional regulator [bacterium]